MDKLPLLEEPKMTKLDPKNMPEDVLIEYKIFLDYFHVDYNADVITLDSGCNSCIMNPNTQWKKFLGHSIADVAYAVAAKLGKKIVWKDDFEDYNNEF